LKITKPLKFKGQTGSELRVTEGPIIINISDNYENEVVKFSQVKIVFQTKDSVENNNDTKFLFKLYSGSLVEIEMCDIICEKSNNSKKICFTLTSMYKKKGDQNVLPQISILTIISTNISKFYQAIRAGENSIINLEKSYINSNHGKAIVILNPLITKIVETVFEKNVDNAIHVKFLKDDSLFNENRKIYIQNCDISYNHGNGIYIDGIENFSFDLDIVISNNLIKRNKLDGVFLCDIYINSLNIFDNKFHENKVNGLNLQKIHYKDMAVKSLTTGGSGSIQPPQDNPSLIVVRNNEFNDSDFFGVLLNDCKAVFTGNTFMRNKQSGIILCVANFSDIYNSSSANKISSNTNNTSTTNESTNITGTTVLKSNTFMKNGCNGIKIYNYSFFVNITECKCIENIDYGIYIETDNVTHDKEKVRNFKNADSSKMPKETCVYINNSTVNSNLKSGLFLNNSFLYFENTNINDNIDFAINTPKEDYRHFFKYNKDKHKSSIVGSVGGPWGEVSITSKYLCSGVCNSTVKIKKKFEENSLPTPNKANSADIVEARREIKKEDNKCYLM
jgi:hypothetical protein